MLDVIALLERHGIPYDPRRTTATNVYIHCPWCGAGDETAHMGIRLDGKAYGCWRDERHRGDDLRWLVRALLGVSLDEAEDLVRGERPAAGIECSDIRARALALQNGPGSPTPSPLTLPSGVAPLVGHGRAGRFRRYLRADRGFRRGDIDAVLREYQLHGGFAGSLRGRLIIPFIEGGELYGFTARATGKHAKLRYLTEPRGHESKQFVMNHDNAAKGGKVLVLVEGPLDCMKLDFYGKTFSVRAVPLLGTSLTDAQAEKIVALADGFERVAVLLDREARKIAVRFSRRYGLMYPITLQLPAGFGDPGELTPRAARILAKKISQ